MARGDRDLTKEQFWRNIFQEWEQSKKSVRAFCAERGVDETKFYCWRRTIAKRDGTYAPSPKGDKSSQQAPVFVPVNVKPSAASGTLEVVVGSGRVIRVPAEFDASALRRLLAVLEAPGC
jgi:hypothetical protein